MKENIAKTIIQEVKNTYNLIADHFNLTRQTNWPETLEFLKYIKEKNRVLDFGCGNGRFYEMIKDLNVDYYGVDISERLLEIAKQKVSGGHFYLIGEDLNLPFADDYFDVVISIATLHHIPSSFLRKKILGDFFRTLKRGGYLLLTVWDFYRGKNKRYLFLNLLRQIKNILFFKKRDLSYKDIFIPWKNEKGEELGKRYFYAFSLLDMKELLNKAGFKIINLKRVSHGEGGKLYNIMVIAQKI